MNMLEDVNTGISWVLRKIDRHGGDCENVVLVGQSAGGQLASLAMIRQVRRSTKLTTNIVLTLAAGTMQVECIIHHHTGAVQLALLVACLEHHQSVWKEFTARAIGKHNFICLCVTPSRWSRHC